MAYNPYTWGDTTPLVKSGYEDSYAELLNHFPFNMIERVTEDGQEMTFFPKTYAKVNSVSGAGRQIIFSDKKKDSSYKLMTAFHDFETGAEVTNGVLHARYMATKNNGTPESKASGTFWGSISYNEIKATAKRRGSGWGPLNIWDYHYRGLLMLLETLAMGYTGADVQTAIGGSAGSMGITHFGITNIWGGTSQRFFIHGLDTFSGAIDGVTISNTNLHIVDKSGVRRDTGIAAPGDDYPITFQTKSVTDQYDMNELLVAATHDGSAANGSCGDYQGLNGGSVFYSDMGTSHTNRGPFYMYHYVPSYALSYLGFALRKAV